jgi:hypothetical protein
MMILSGYLTLFVGFKSQLIEYLGFVEILCGVWASYYYLDII